MENTDELLIRRKRVNDDGNWDYECNVCNKWLPQSKFRGCKEFIDAYGNCLMCASCRAIKAQKTQKTNIQDELIRVLKALGYDTDSQVSIHQQFCNRHKLKPHRNYLYYDEPYDY